MHSRTNPAIARIKERYLLTGSDSSKKTYHIVLDTQEAGVSFQIGDSLAVLPNNEPKLIDQILQHLKANGSEDVFDFRSNTHCTFRDYLLHRANITKVTSPFFKLLCERGKPLELTKEALTAYLHSHSVLDLLRYHQPQGLSPSEFCKPLLPLMPRFYSIASSPKMFPGEIHLTVAHLTYMQSGELRFGVGSHFLCEEAEIESTPIPVYIQPSNHFTLPLDPTSSIILVGPGTGIAPFRAFLQERMATASQGRNWLFFGERNRSTDFYYSDFWLELEQQGRLRLDLAFSRDQAEKIYVQHRMLENKKSLWNWLQEGAYLYVCGDAEKMAKDVDAALQQIAREEGQMKDDEVKQYIKSLRTQKRYLLDVY